jgi:DnaK suppressor protein
VIKKAPVKKIVAKAKAPAVVKPRTILDLDQPTGMYNGIVLCEKVKPFPAKTPYTMKELDKLREVLRDEQHQLTAALNSLKGASMEAFDVSKDHPGYSIHMAEHATDLQTAETNLGVRSIEADRLAQVEQALERIEHNVSKYGLCLACGSKIGIQRLIARPHAHLCMNCRTRYEEIRRRRGL